MASKAKSSRRLRSAVVANARALDAVKKREFGYWQTTNSVLDGAQPDEHMGNSYNQLTTERPVLIHLNNLHSCNGPLPPDPNTSSATTPVPHNEQQGACHLLVASSDDATPEISKDGLVRHFKQPCTFAVNGVVQKQKRTGPHMYPRVGYPGQDPLLHNDTPLIPIPNGKKVKWGGVDLQFRIEGALQDTQFDFYIVKCNKEKPLNWDPWHQTIPDEARSVPGVLPYTINDFQYLHHSMYPKKLDTKRYNVLSHRRVLVNNVHRVTGQSGHIHLAPDNAKYATGNTWSHTVDDNGPWDMTPTHPATTPAVQHLRMSYKPNSIVRPLRNFIGERLDTPTEQRGSFADANPLEKATLGTMSFDNFHPSANVWLVMTTNHQRITTPRIRGPYSHKGYEGMVAVSPAGQFAGANYTKAPDSYTTWLTQFGTDERETQLEKAIAQYGVAANSGASWFHKYAPGGLYDTELKAIREERQDRDAYRNPRIHIFRRTWWQDEHIPTELSEALAVTKEEAEIQSTPVAPTNPQAKTPVGVAEIRQRLRHAQMTLKRARDDPDMSAFDTSSNDPTTWPNAAWAAGHALHQAGATIPAKYLNLINGYPELMGLCDFYGVPRWTYQLLQRMSVMAQPPTPDAPLDPMRKRLKDWQNVLQPSNDPMQQDPPVG